MKRFIGRHLIWLFPLLLSSTIQGQPVEEEPMSGFGISPTSITIDARPGQEAEAKFTIATQNTRKPSRFSIQVMDLGQDVSGAITAVEAGTGARSASEFITVASEIIIPPNGREEVPISVNLPPNANGAYFAYLVVRLLPERPEALMAAVVQPAALVAVSVLTRSEIVLRVDVEELSITPGTTGSPWDIALRTANIGTWKTSVEGDVLLYTEKNVFPIRFPVTYGRNERPIEIYPGLEVILRAPMTKTLTAGNYNVVARLLLNGQYKSVSHLNIEIPQSIGKENIIGQLISKSEFDLNLWVEPDLVELTLTPGAVRTVPIRIQNRDERPARVFASVRDVTMEKNGLLTFPEGGFENEEMVKVIPESLEVAPRRTAVLRAQISVPRDTSGIGAFMRAVHIKISGPKTEEEWGNDTEFGVLLVASDPKSPPAEMEIDELTLIRPNPDSNPATAVVSLKNSGEKVARFKGEIAVERVTGESIATMEIGRGQDEIILPGAVREYRMGIPPLDAGDFRVRAEFTTIGKEAVKAKNEVTFTSTAEIPEGLR